MIFSKKKFRKKIFYIFFFRNTITPFFTRLRDFCMAQKRVIAIFKNLLSRLKELQMAKVLINDDVVVASIAKRSYLAPDANLREVLLISWLSYQLIISSSISPKNAQETLIGSGERHGSQWLRFDTSRIFWSSRYLLGEMKRESEFLSLMLITLSVDSELFWKVVSSAWSQWNRSWYSHVAIRSVWPAGKGARCSLGQFFRRSGNEFIV